MACLKAKDFQWLISKDMVICQDIQEEPYDQAKARDSTSHKKKPRYVDSFAVGGMRTGARNSGEPEAVRCSMR